MRKVITVFSLMLIITCLGFAQEIKKNQSTQLLKEDSNNSYKIDKITDLDTSA
jgi:magnesium-transporting ATPase (P-type)